MKKHNMIKFTFINPFKRGFYISVILKLSSYEYIKYSSFKSQYPNIEIIFIDKSELLKLGILKK